MPEECGTVLPGFKEDEELPKDFIHQIGYGFGKTKSKE